MYILNQTNCTSWIEYKNKYCTSFPTSSSVMFYFQYLWKWTNNRKAKQYISAVSKFVHKIIIHLKITFFWNSIFCLNQSTCAYIICFCTLTKCKKWNDPIYCCNVSEVTTIVLWIAPKNKAYIWHTFHCNKLLFSKITLSL